MKVKRYFQEDDIELGEGEVAVTRKRMEDLGHKILEECIKKVDDFIEHKDLDNDDAEMFTLLKINNALAVMETVEKLINALFEEEDGDERPS